MCGQVIRRELNVMSCSWNHMIEAFTVTLLKVTFQRKSYGAFRHDEAPVEGLWEAAVQCHAPTIHHYYHTVIQMEWEICLPKSKLCRWEEEMTMDLFPLGHTGVALDRMETNRRELREEVFWSLKSGCPRWRTWLLLSPVSGALWMIKMITWGVRHGHAQVHSVGGVVFRLFLHRLATAEM